MQALRKRKAALRATLTPNEIEARKREYLERQRSGYVFRKLPPTVELRKWTDEWGNRCRTVGCAG